MTRNSFSHFCQGESHKADGKPCQDYCTSIYDPDLGLTLAIVSDGHGGDRYFRSQYGSQFAVECTIDAIKEFVRCVDKSIFSGCRYTGIATKEDESIEKLGTTQAVALRQLASSIIYHWRLKVKDHASSHQEFSEWEMSHVDEKYRNDMLSHSINDEVPVKTYGCTLMAYAQTRDYWFAFQIGDGKCIAFFEEKSLWGEPIPWDKNCFLNKTTSLCNSNSLDLFRFCYEGDGIFPLAIFLGSDGVDDSLGDNDNLADFYGDIFRILGETSADKVEGELKVDLPELSKQGSKDDMSIACVFDPERLEKCVSLVAAWQLPKARKLLIESYKKLGTLELQKCILQYKTSQTKSERKELQDVESVFQQARLQNANLKKKYETLRNLI